MLAPSHRGWPLPPRQEFLRGMSFSGPDSSYSRIYLMIMGAIFLVVGLGVALFLEACLAGGANAPHRRSSSPSSVAACSLPALLVGRNVTAQNQIMQTGISGMATITGLTQTGVYVNETATDRNEPARPAAGRNCVRDEITEIVPLMMLGRLSNGQPLAVRVDQMDRYKTRRSTGVAIRCATPAPAYGAAPMTGMAGMPMPAVAMAGMPGAAHGARADRREPRASAGRARRHRRNAGRQHVLPARPAELHRSNSYAPTCARTDFRRRRTSTSSTTRARPSAMSTCTRWR